MQGRIKRKQRERELHEQVQSREAAPTCALCHRPLGTRVEYHHPVPKSEGGNITVPVHPICHRAIHAHVSNHDLAEHYADLDTLREREDMQRFLRWIANKPPDFHAPTRHNRDKTQRHVYHQRGVSVDNLLSVKPEKPAATARAKDP